MQERGPVASRETHLGWSRRWKLLGEKKEPVRGWLYRKRTCNSIGEFQKNEQRTVASWATEKSQRREKAVLQEGGQRIREVCYFNTNTVNLETAPPPPRRSSLGTGHRTSP